MHQFFSKNRYDWVLLLLILLLGSALRLYGLDKQSLWNDELESWRQSNFDSLSEVINQGVVPDTHPPAFQSVLFFVEKYLGDSEVFLRLPSAISGVLCIAVIFLIGKRIFSYREGLIAALFIAVMWAPISMSQEARNYSILVLFSLLAGYFWLDILLVIRDRSSIPISALLGYIFSALALAYTHYYGLLLAILQSISLFIFAIIDRGYFRKLFIMFALIVVGYLPWIPYLLEQSTHTVRISWIELPKITAFPALISFYFNRIEPLAILILCFYAFLFTKLIWDYRKGPGRDLGSLLTSTEFLLAYWLIAPLAVVFIISYLWTPFLTQRNLLISLPAAYLLLARGITLLPIKRFWQAGIALLLAGIPLVYLITHQGYYNYPSKEQYREAVQYVVERNEPYGDTLILGYSRLPDYFNYYFTHFGSSLSVQHIVGTAEDIDKLQEIIAERDPEYVWYISAHRKPDAEFLNFLEESYTVIEEKPYYGARVRLLRID